MKQVKALIIFMLIISAQFLVANGEMEDLTENMETDTISNLNLEGFPIVKEKISLRLMGPKTPLHVPWEEMAFFQIMEEKTNIAFDYISPPASAWKQKLSLTFASGDLPDIFIGLSRDRALSTLDLDRYGDQGLLLPLEDYIEKYAPNITRRFSEREDIRKSATALSGHIYSIPEVNDATIAKFSTTWINGAWLKNLGITEDTLPTTTQGFKELLIRFRDEDPNRNGEKDDIPIGTTNSFEIRIPLLAAFGLLTQSKIGMMLKDEEPIHGAIDDNYRSYLSYVKELYEEGLIDEEAFTNTRTQMYAKGKENRIGMFYGAVPQLALPGSQTDHLALPALTSEVNPTAVYPMNSGIYSPAVALTNKNRHPEASLRWFDYFWTAEGELLVHYGPEGVLYEWNADKSLKVPTTLPEGKDFSQVRGSLTPDVGVLMGKFTESQVEERWADPWVQHRFDQNETRYLPHGRIPFPRVRYTAEESKQAVTLRVDIDKYIKEMEAKFIYGVTPLDDEQWAKYISTLEKMNIAEYIEINKKAYDRWQKF